MPSRVLSFLNDISHILYPHVCEICGDSLSKNAQFLCSECLNNSFNSANPHSKLVSSDTIMPEFIYGQHALWEFDKFGVLQDILHKLKYQRLSGIAVDIGKNLGKSLKQNDQFDSSIDWILVPVPLHKSRLRKRGFNQAYSIALGIQAITNYPILEKEILIRTKNTKTQTGFSLSERKKNVEGAFKVTQTERLSHNHCVIIDDVFTTGATTFELASTLMEAGVQRIYIATVAQA